MRGVPHGYVHILCRWMALVPEVTMPGHDHGEACLVGSLDDLVIAHGSARLDDGRRASFRCGEQPVREGEEGVGGHH